MGIYIDIVDKYGLTPLHLTCICGYTRLPEILIKNGANINKANNFGMTPLHIAACSGHVSLVKLLLKYGANKNLEDEGMLLPFDYTRNKHHNKYIQIAELLA